MTNESEKKIVSEQNWDFLTEIQKTYIRQLRLKQILKWLEEDEILIKILRWYL